MYHGTTGRLNLTGSKPGYFLRLETKITKDNGLT